MFGLLNLRNQDEYSRDLTIEQVSERIRQKTIKIYH